MIQSQEENGRRRRRRIKRRSKRRNKETEKEPTTFEVAWYHNDPESRRKWRESIGLEFKNMEKRIVYFKMLKAKKPEGKTSVKLKWVFKIKRNGTYRARLVACG